MLLSWLIQVGDQARPGPGERAWEALRTEVAPALLFFRLSYQMSPCCDIRKEGKCLCLTTCKVCILQAAMVRTGPAKRVLATSRMHQPYFFLKADGFKETCLSFNVASLSLTWALKPCDRASD